MKHISKSELRELIENDLEIQRRIASTITSDPDFRKRIAYEIASEVVRCETVLEWKIVGGDEEGWEL